MSSRSTLHRSARAAAGFGLVDVMVALALLAIALLGACGSLHFALRASRASAWQSTAVDLVADLAEDLQLPDAALPSAVRLDAWRARLRLVLPTGEVAALQARTVTTGDLHVSFSDLQLEWTGMPGQPAQSLRLPLATVLVP